MKGCSVRAAVNTIAQGAVAQVGPDLCCGVIRDPVIPSPPTTLGDRQKATLPRI